MQLESQNKVGGWKNIWRNYGRKFYEFDETISSQIQEAQETPSRIKKRRAPQGTSP